MHIIFSLHIEHYTFRDISLASSLNCQSNIVVCDPLYVVIHHGMHTHCNTVSFIYFILVCTLKVLALNIKCILSSCEPLFSAWSSFSLPGIPYSSMGGYLVNSCVHLDAATLMALVILFKASFVV